MVRDRYRFLRPSREVMKRDDIVACPYTNAEIAAKIDFTPDYAAAICYLLEHGEERLLIAIERGLMPANIAMEIARAPDGDVQHPPIPSTLRRQRPIRATRPCLGSKSVSIRSSRGRCG